MQTSSTALFLACSGGKIVRCYSFMEFINEPLDGLKKRPISHIELKAHCSNYQLLYFAFLFN